MTSVAMQKDMVETKIALENTIKEHKESVKNARTIENDISVRETSVIYKSCLITTVISSLDYDF